MRTEKSFSRWGFIFAVLGMAVGTGNIWRFPRILAVNGGGAFLIPWTIFLFLWSIPLLITEFAIGQHTRKSPLGAFGSLIGKRFSWMGGFVVLCTMGIMFYYSVVAGWCLKYFFASLDGSLFRTLENAGGVEFWNQFLNTKYQPVLFHGLAVLIGTVILLNGIVGGIERANKILIPGLILLLFIAVIKALSLKNSLTGLEFLFNPDWSSLKNAKIWLEGLSQSAWSTGAGWGLALTYATYVRKKEDIVLNTYVAGFGNNSMSLLASMAIFPAVFALAPLLGLDPHTSLTETGPASTGLTFIWIPQLFLQTSGGRFFSAIFFLVLTFAAITSLISMFTLAARMFFDFGISWKKAVILVAIITFLCGIPSALSIDIFENQDWVWGIGLLVNGAFFTFAILKYGADKFKNEIILKAQNDINLGNWYIVLMKYILPLEFVALISWWFYKAIQWEPNWWHPLKPFSIATCFVQWGLVLLILIAFNHKINQKVFNVTRGK